MVQLETAAFVHPTDGERGRRGAVTLHQFPMITFEVRIASRSIRVKKWRETKNEKRSPPTSNLSGKVADFPEEIESGCSPRPPSVRPSVRPSVSPARVCECI